MGETDSEEVTNPAERLHWILSRAQRVINSTGPARGNAGGVWATVFGIAMSPGADNLNEAQMVEVISRVHQFRKLIDETEERLREIDDLPDRYFRPFGRIRVIPFQTLASIKQRHKHSDPRNHGRRH